jgi:hypothetical protein
MEKYTYYIIYKEFSKVAEMDFNIGGEAKDSTIIRLKGRSIKKVFHDTIILLSRYGGIIPVEVADARKVYAVREDLGSLVGAYLLMLRRARNYSKWHRFLERLLNEEFPGVAIVLSNFLEIALELSKMWTIVSDKKRIQSQKAFDIVSSTLKHFVNKLEKMHKV